MEVKHVFSVRFLFIWVVVWLTAGFLLMNLWIQLPFGIGALYEQTITIVFELVICVWAARFAHEFGHYLPAKLLYPDKVSIVDIHLPIISDPFKKVACFVPRVELTLPETLTIGLFPFATGIVSVLIAFAFKEGTVVSFPFLAFGLANVGFSGSDIWLAWSALKLHSQGYSSFRVNVDGIHAVIIGYVKTPA